MSADSWVLMTGTPHNGEKPFEWLNQSYHLLHCIRHPVAHNHVTWIEKITKPLTKPASAVARSAALATFSRAIEDVFIFHEKGAVMLPAPEHEVMSLRLSRAGIRAYNAVVAAGQLNMKLTAMAGATPGAGLSESLLHSSKQKEAAEVLRNVFKACSGNGDHVAQITLENRNETKLLLRDQFKVADSIMAKIMTVVDGFAIISDEKASKRQKALAALNRREASFRGPDSGSLGRRTSSHEGRRHGSAVYVPCARCGIELQNPAFTPCGHFFCPECITPYTDRCEAPTCGLPFPEVPKVLKDSAGDVLVDERGRLVLSNELEHPQDAFANLQAGATVEWRQNAQAAQSNLIGYAFVEEQRRQQRAEGRHGAFVVVNEKYTPSSNKPVVPPKVGLRELFKISGAAIVSPGSKSSSGGGGGGGSSSSSSSSSASEPVDEDELAWADPKTKAILRENSKARYVVKRMREIMADECARGDARGKDPERPLKVGAKPVRVFDCSAVCSVHSSLLNARV